jgi:ubiquinone/menaquinone biosynthesis C-methylase UbiE
MELSEAIALIRPGVTEPAGTWADFGSGAGTFSNALAELLGPRGRVLAIDRDASALRKLRKRDYEPDRAVIETVVGDFRELHSIPELSGLTLDGVLFANALHFVPDPDVVLGQAVNYLRRGGTALIIEYEGRAPSPWVPYPIPSQRLPVLAEQVGLTTPVVIGTRKSRYRGSLYCAVTQRA